MYLSTEQTPIYILSRALTLTNFIPQISKLVNKEFGEMDEDKKSVLNIIYRYNFYNKQLVKPSTITPELFQQKFGSEINPTIYESLGRKVRKICSDLLNEDILHKPDSKGYAIKNLETSVPIY